MCVPYLQGHIVWHTSLPHASSLPEVCCMMDQSSDLGTRQQLLVVNLFYQLKREVDAGRLTAYVHFV